MKMDKFKPIQCNEVDALLEQDACLFGNIRRKNFELRQLGSLPKGAFIPLNQFKKHELKMKCQR